MPKDLCDMIGSFVVADVSTRLSCNKHNGMDRIKALPYFKVCQAWSLGVSPDPVWVTSRAVYTAHSPCQCEGWG